MLHDGPPYANGDLHIGKLRWEYIKSDIKLETPFWTTNQLSLQPIVGDRTHPLCPAVQCIAQPPGRDNVWFHTGHALNKVLKDFILKFELLQGKRARYVPGWDCHGLPIELKVLQGMTDEQRRDLTTIKLRRKARDFALKAVNQQRESFKR